MPDKLMALELVLTRMDRRQADEKLKEYLVMRIDSAIEELKGKGITLTDSAEDLALLVDYTVWQYQNRDKASGMPDWLRLKVRERWLRQQRGDNA